MLPKRHSIDNGAIMVKNSNISPQMVLKNALIHNGGRGPSGKSRMRS